MKNSLTLMTLALMLGGALSQGFNNAISLGRRFSTNTLPQTQGIVQPRARGDEIFSLTTNFQRRPGVVDPNAFNVLGQQFVQPQSNQQLSFSRGGNQIGRNSFNSGQTLSTNDRFLGLARPGINVVSPRGQNFLPPSQQTTQGRRFLTIQDFNNGGRGRGRAVGRGRANPANFVTFRNQQPGIANFQSRRPLAPPQPIAQLGTGQNLRQQVLTQQPQQTRLPQAFRIAEQFQNSGPRFGLQQQRGIPQTIISQQRAQIQQQQQIQQQFPQPQQRQQLLLPTQQQLPNFRTQIPVQSSQPLFRQQVQVQQLPSRGQQQIQLPVQQQQPQPQPQRSEREQQVALRQQQQLAQQRQEIEDRMAKRMEDFKSRSGLQSSSNVPVLQRPEVTEGNQLDALGQQTRIQINQLPVSQTQEAQSQNRLPPVQLPQPLPPQPAGQIRQTQALPNGRTQIVQPQQPLQQRQVQIRQDPSRGRQFQQVQLQQGLRAPQAIRLVQDLNARSLTQTGAQQNPSRIQTSQPQTLPFPGLRQRLITNQQLPQQQQQQQQQSQLPHQQILQQQRGFPQQRVQTQPFPQPQTFQSRQFTQPRIQFPRTQLARTQFPRTQQFSRTQFPRTQIQQTSFPRAQRIQFPQRFSRNRNVQTPQDRTAQRLKSFDIGNTLQVALQTNEDGSQADLQALADAAFDQTIGRTTLPPAPTTRKPRSPDDLFQFNFAGGFALSGRDQGSGLKIDRSPSLQFGTDLKQLGFNSQTLNGLTFFDFQGQRAIAQRIAKEQEERRRRVNEARAARGLPPLEVTTTTERPRINSFSQGFAKTFGVGNEGQQVDPQVIDLGTGRVIPSQPSQTQARRRVPTSQTIARQTQPSASRSRVPTSQTIARQTQPTAASSTRASTSSRQQTVAQTRPRPTLPTRTSIATQTRTQPTAQTLPITIAQVRTQPTAQTQTRPQSTFQSSIATQSSPSSTEPKPTEAKRAPEDENGANESR